MNRSGVDCCDPPTSPAAACPYLGVSKLLTETLVLGVSKLLTEALVLGDGAGDQSFSLLVLYIGEGCGGPFSTTAVDT